MATNKYTAIIQAIEDWLNTETNSPFKSVEAVGWSLHPDQIGTRLEQAVAPAALVYFGGGDTNGGRGGQLDVDPGISIAVVARGKSADDASQGSSGTVGLNDLIEFVQQLHGKVGISGMQNPVYFSRVDPFVLPWRPLTVAAVVLRFSSTLTWAESLT